MATQPAQQPAPLSERVGNRAFGPGSPVVRFVVAGIAAVVAAGIVIALLSGGGGAKAVRKSTVVRPPSLSARPIAHRPSHKYGYIPAWLPKATIPVSRIVTATPAHPWLAIQGDTVRVKLAGGQVLATVAGPNTPEQGHFPIPKSTLCTFTVTFAAARGVVPLSSREFAAIDEVGQLHTLSVRMLGGGPIPPRLTPGKTISLVVTAVLPVGEGRFLWAPVRGRPVVQWDYDVEID